MSDYELYHASRKKHKYIKKIGDRYFYTQQEIAAYLKEKKKDVTFEKGETADYRDVGDNKKMKEYRIDFAKKYDKDGNRIWSHGVGVEVGNKKITLYNTTNKKYEKNPDVKDDRHGRFTREYAEDGARYSLDYSSKKEFRKRQRDNIKREKESVKWLNEHNIDSSEVENRLKDDKAYLNRQLKKDKRRKKVAKKISSTAKKSMGSLKKQAAKGKKKLNNLTKPKSTVTVIDRIDQRTGEHF